MHVMHLRKLDYAKNFVTPILFLFLIVVYMISLCEYWKCYPNYGLSVAFKKAISLCAAGFKWNVEATWLYLKKIYAGKI